MRGMKDVNDLEKTWWVQHRQRDRNKGCEAQLGNPTWSSDFLYFRLGLSGPTWPILFGSAYGD